MTADPQGKLSVRGVFAEMWRVYRSHWRFLVPAAVVVLLPQSIADGILEGFHVEHIRNLLDVATIGVALLTAMVNLIGQAVYAGLTAAAVVDWRAGQPLPPFMTLLRLVLLSLPGLIFLTDLAAAAPVMTLEHLGVRDSMLRSIELVRGNAVQVFVLVAGVVVVTESAVQAIAIPFHGAGVLSAVNLLGEGIFQPFEGLVVAIVAVTLLQLHGQAASPDVMARALVAEQD